MKIIVVGASGTIGSAVVDSLSDHEVIKVGRHSGTVQADLSDPASLKTMYEQIGIVDAVVCVGGKAAFGTVEELTDDDMEITLKNLRGKFDLVRYGLPYLRDGGAFVFTSGDLTNQPIPTSAIVTPMGAALEAFVRTTALALPRGLRIYAVSPPLILETALKHGYGDQGIPAAKVAGWFLESLIRKDSGKVRSEEGWS